MSLSKLSFGAPAAERDIALGLSQYFVESDAFQRLQNRSKTLVLGNRGSGKSALFKVLAERERQKRSVVIELSPEDYSYEIMSRTLKSESEGAWAKHGAFSAAWKYLIIVLVMKAITDIGKVKTGDAATIYNYLRDNHKGFQKNPIATLISYIKRMEGIKIGPYEASVKTRELQELYKIEELMPLIDPLKRLCHKNKVFVFVDELDRGWDSSEDAKAFVSGLFQACIWINSLCDSLTVYVSLRRELYDSIPVLYDDTQKYRDIIEILNWDEDSLLSLIAKRIRFCMDDLAKSNDIECWNHVFSETLQYRKTKSFNYIVDRTLYRPREIIQFCAESLEEYSRQNVYPIDYQVISSAESKYSEERVQDISAEYRFQYPGLRSIFEVFRGARYTMQRDDLEYTWLSISTGESRVDSKAEEWISHIDTDGFIDMLWRVGFLRAQAVGGVKTVSRSGSKYLGPHQISSLNLKNISRFHIHPMFRAYLGLKESK